MNTLTILQQRARRSIARWQQHETEQAAAEARIDGITVAIAQAVEATDLVGDHNAHEHRITRLAHLLHGDPCDPELFRVVDRWVDESPDDDIIEQLYSALVVIEGGEVTPDHWLRESTTN